MVDAKIKRMMGGYLLVEAKLEDAVRLVRELSNAHPDVGDLKECLRILANFDYFYSSMKKRMRDYLPLPHDVRDMLTGRVIIDKVGLHVEGGRRLVRIVFDKRISKGEIFKALEQAGVSFEEEA